MEANEKFPDKKGTPALKVMIEESLKESIRYFYEVQCERKLYDRYKDKWYSQMKANRMMKYLPEELYPNVIE